MHVVLAVAFDEVGIGAVRLVLQCARYKQGESVPTVPDERTEQTCQQAEVA